ncbi:MAG: hypothetical protein ABW136_12295, partial [Steroidobacteraceae bacterium]
MNGGTHTDPALDEAGINAHLQRVLTSEGFAKSATNCRLLTYLVQRHLQGADAPKEAELAIDVFGRDASFHGGDDSVVRVAVRGMRQKLLEYYAGPGKNDRLVLDVPKGSYRLRTLSRDETAVAPDPAAVSTPVVEAAPQPATPELLPSASTRSRISRSGWLAVAAGALLVLSMAFNVLQWTLQRERSDDPALAVVRASALWQPVVASSRPVLVVLGDIFMYTQTDAATGRTQTVRDPQISSPEELRAFLASNPALASVRGLRYASYLQKSTAVALAKVLPVVTTPGREVEVRLRDELRTEDFARYDIVYAGPLVRLGPLDAALQGVAQYRFDAATSGVADIAGDKVFRPEGDLGEHRKDYALVSRFRGPEGSQVVILTAGGRNAGLTQVVRTVTTPEGLEPFERALRDAKADARSAFQAVLEVAGYRQTDLSA